MSNPRYPESDIAAIYRVIYERRDVRHFLPDPIKPEILHQILTAAHHAPSVGFMQPWRFVRISDRSVRHNIHQLVEQERIATAKALGEREDEFMRLKVEGVLECGEVLVAALCDRREDYVFGRRTLPEMDLASLSCAIQNMWLAARSEGLGMGWVSLFEPRALKNLLNMPQGSQPMAILCLGHVEKFYEKPMLEQEQWAERKDLNDLLFENSWDTPCKLSPVMARQAQDERVQKLTVRPELVEGFNQSILNIHPVSSSLTTALQKKIDQKTKPLGALGQLEVLALKLGLIQNSLTPYLNKPALLIFAGDHGIVEAGVSAYPQSVTAQMVANFLAGGAAISVFAKQHRLELFVVDAGVNADLASHPRLLDAKIAKGTANFLHQAAMSESQCFKAIECGAELVMQQHVKGSNCIGFGEMGIGNTSSAALLLHCLTGLPLEQCVGRGTGLDDEQLAHKLHVLQQALIQHQDMQAPLIVLATFGGFEVAMMVGAYLKAAELAMVIIVDGFIASAALLVATQLNSHVLDYCIFSHVSSEQGHQALLAYLKAQPLLNLNLRLGEGSGIAIAYPILQSAVLFLNEMATFADAGVDESTL